MKDTEFPAGIAIILLPFHLLWNGFILLNLWRWLFVPLGIPQIGIMHAIGIGLALAFCCKARRLKPLTIVEFITDFLCDVLVLLVCYIVSFWV